MFNAYHAAYLGARGVMTLLGVSLPNLRGRQVLLDLFPQPTKKSAKSFAAPSFGDFLLVPLPHLDQRYIWEGLQRVLRMTKAAPWSESVVEEVLGLSFEDITPPRNHFLYKAHYWPLEDLASDDDATDFSRFYGVELAPDAGGFLLRLGFCMYLLFEQLISDLALVAPLVAEQVRGSRCAANPVVPELLRYRSFLSDLVVAESAL